jgi:hypothetical protein
LLESPAFKGNSSRRAAEANSRAAATGLLRFKKEQLNSVLLAYAVCNAFFAPFFAAGLDTVFAAAFSTTGP